MKRYGFKITQACNGCYSVEPNESEHGEFVKYSDVVLMDKPLDKPGRSWCENPLVWRIEFKVVKP